MMQGNCLDATIVAAATPPGRGGIAVVRVSGALVPQLVQQCLKNNSPQPRKTYHIRLTHTDDQHQIDEGILIWFAAPNSYTGEDVLEFHGHGNPILVRAVVNYFIEQGCQHAPPGAFTQRAFLNEKLDLLQAEAVADLIHSESQLAARAAMRSLQGEFSKAIQSLEADILDCRMRVESSIDFSDQDIDFSSNQILNTQIQAIQQTIRSILKKSQTGHVLHAGLTAVILGPPNVGKSSLFNALCQQDAAIVTPYAGTTRDVLERTIMLDNVPFTLLDTAGIHHTHEAIEQAGIQRALAAITSADLILFIGDATRHCSKDLEHFWQEHIQTPYPEDRLCCVWNKRDLKTTVPLKQQPGIHISALKNEGLEDLSSAILKKLGLDQSHTDVMIPARQRHLTALKSTEKLVAEALSALHNHSLDWVAESLKQAHQTLSTLYGNSHHDAVLAEIFSTFCIGK